MTARVWLYNRLVNAGFSYGASSRVFAKKGMTSVVEDFPLIVYKLGNQTDEALSEESQAGRQFIQIFIHDHSSVLTGDYIRIDDLVEELKALLRNASSPADNVITVQYLETSQDLNDETVGSVMKYVRFQLIMGDNNA